MASLETLGVGSLSLRGANNDYNRLSRFFLTKVEAEAALSSGSWMPVEGVLNACITGDEGLQIYDFSNNELAPCDSTIRPYIDAKVSEIIAGAPDALDTLSELASALGDSPTIISDMQTSLTNEITARASGDNGLDVRLISAEGAISTLNGQVTALQGADTVLSDLGTFTGDVIGDNIGLQAALQAVETAIESKAATDSPTFTTAFRYEGTQMILRDTVGGAGSDVIFEINNKDFKIRNVQNAAVIISTSDVARLTIDGSGSASFSGDVDVSGKLTSASGVIVQVHGSFDASTSGSFDFANDGIASFGVSGIVRNSAGNFTVTFSSPFASAAYTVVAQAGDQDYSGVGASPRSVCVTNRTATTVDLIVERTDDAVNDDNGYVSFMIIGTLA